MRVRARAVLQNDVCRILFPIEPLHHGRGLGRLGSRVRLLDVSRVGQDGDQRLLHRLLRPHAARAAERRRLRRRQRRAAAARRGRGVPPAGVGPAPALCVRRGAARHLVAGGQVDPQRVGLFVAHGADAQLPQELGHLERADRGRVAATARGHAALLQRVARLHRDDAGRRLHAVRVHSHPVRAQRAGGAADRSRSAARRVALAAGSCGRDRRARRRGGLRPEARRAGGATHPPRRSSLHPRTPPRRTRAARGCWLRAHGLLLLLQVNNQKVEAAFRKVPTSARN